MEAVFLPALAKRGISAQEIASGVLRLSPKSAITDRVREVVNAHKEEILAELRQSAIVLSSMVDASESQAEADIVDSVVCPECNGEMSLIPSEVDSDTSADTGQWFRAKCRCGYECYMCERDYKHWQSNTFRFKRHKITS